MKLIIVSDTLPNQVNGVTTTLKYTLKEIKNLDVEVLYPKHTIPCPFYSEVSLAYRFTEYDKLDSADYIHILTEGPLGFFVKNYCIKNNLKFTTSYLTKFPENIKKIVGIPENISFYLFRKFHEQSSTIMVVSETMKQYLIDKGFNNNIKIWGKGIDTKLFKPQKKIKDINLLYVGRLSKEKSIEEFLDIDLPYKKIVVGDGPIKNSLELKYPNVEFTGYLHGKELASVYAQTDVFVFPSKSETFGLVMLEALACGTPVAAYPVCGPIDVINNKVGCLNNNLKFAIEEALKCDRKDCRKLALEHSWKEATNKFINNLVRSRIE